MTHKQQIAAALKVLEPPPGKVAVCRRDIEAVLGFVESSTKAKIAHKVVGSTKGRDSLRPYKNALKDALAWRAKVHPAIRVWLHADLDREMDSVKEMLARPSAPKRAAIKIKEAKDMAHNLLMWWGHTPVTTRKGNWDQLTKALAGLDASAKSLHGHLCRPKPMAVVRRKNAVGLISMTEEARRWRAVIQAQASSSDQGSGESP